MKITKYVCDRCGKEISGAILQLYGELVEATEDRGLLYTREEMPERYGRLEAMDLCGECEEEIFGFIFSPKNDHPTMIQAPTKPIVAEEEPKEEPKKETPKKAHKSKHGASGVEFTDGSIAALYKAGRDAKWMAQEFGKSEKTIYYHISKLKKQGGN